MRHLRKTAAMAARNLLRGRRRTASTLVAIAVGLVGLTVLDGYITDSMRGLRESVIHSGTGHIQVARAAAFFDEGDNDPFPFMMEEAPALARELRAMPQVADVVPAVSFFAVMSAQGKTGTVQVTALSVGQAKRNLSGRNLTAGEDLRPGETGRILVGRGAARKLGIAPGATVSLFALNKGGGVNTQTYTVAGTTGTAIAALDNVSVFMDLADAQSLIGTQAVPQLIVFLKSTADTEAVMARLGASDGPSAGPGFSARSWEELSPYYRQAHTAYQMVLGVARLIVLIVALFSISGTLTLAVLERLGEIGTLRAFGTKRRQVLCMFLLEGLLLGLVGAIFGGLAGGGTAALINAAGGLTMPPQPGTSGALVIHFTPELSTFFMNGVWVLLAAVAGSLLPGTLSSRKTIAELLRSR